MRRILLLLFFTFICKNIFCQSRAIDYNLISCSVNKTEINYYNEKSGNHNRFMQHKEGSIIQKYNPLSLSLGILMYTYQNIVSPQLFSSCRYTLTCSNFSKAAIKEFGILKGIALSADRLLRCNHYNISELPSHNFTLKGKIMDEPNQYRLK